MQIKEIKQNISLNNFIKLFLFSPIFTYFLSFFTFSPIIAR